MFLLPTDHQPLTTSSVVSCQRAGKSAA